MRVGRGRTPDLAPSQQGAAPPPPSAPPLNGHRPSEPPHSSLARAMGNHKALIAIVALLCAAVGVGFGLSRTPVYSASASLQVGQVNPNSPGFASYTQSATALAAAFSRAVVAEPVLDAVQRKLGVPPGAAAARLSAEPIPLSPLIKVAATGPSAPAATALANTASTAMISYVGKSNSSNPEAKALLREYSSASEGLHAAQAKVGGLEAEGASGKKLLKAEAEQSVAQIEVEALNRSYVAAIISQAPRAGLLSLVAGAASAGADRKSKVELYGFLGLLIGLVLGCGAAALREARSAAHGVDAGAQPAHS